MESGSFGPKQRAWVAAGYRFFVDEDLIFPIVFASERETPIAALPSFARGQCLDMMFGWCMADLREQRAGWLGLVERLSELEAPAPATD